MDVRPLTPDLWPALEDLFGKAGASNGCWCMYWRLGGAYARRPRSDNKADFQAIVNEGPPPGLLAFEGGRAVGWCQVTPRADLPWLERARHLGRVDETPVWVVSCFFIRRTHRRKGVASALIGAALAAARRAGAPALEAYPIDVSQAGATRNRYTGVAASFERAGFKVIARRAADRPIMRHDLEEIASEA